MRTMSPISNAQSQSGMMLLDGEAELAATVLRALWFQLLGPGHIQMPFENRAQRLSCLTTVDGYRQALHGYFANVSAGRPVDRLDRAVALDFISENLIEIAPQWAIESDNGEVLRTGIYCYTPENPTDEAWMDDTPVEEQSWFRACGLLDLLKENDGLSAAETARETMLASGMTQGETDQRLREVIAPLARISERELEILGVEGCRTPITVPDDWSRRPDPTDEEIYKDLDELVSRVHDDDGQPRFKAGTMYCVGRCIEMDTESRLSPTDTVRCFVEVFRLADDSCEVRIAAGGRARFIHTPPSTWGAIARVDQAAESWAELLGVSASAYSELAYAEVDRSRA